MSDDSQAFVDLEGALLSDPDDDVAVDGDRFTVKGTLFAFRDGDALVVDLPPQRAGDLLDRDVATPEDGGPEAKGRWVRVADREDWVELATEAHQFVGEPAVGRDS